MSAKPIKVANRSLARQTSLVFFNKKDVYDIADYRELDIKPVDHPNEHGVLMPQLFLAFKNTKTALFLVLVSRSPDGLYRYNFEIVHHTGGGSMGSPSMNSHKVGKTLKDCLINAMEQCKSSEYDPELAEAATKTLPLLTRVKTYQMSIFYIL